MTVTIEPTTTPENTTTPEDIAMPEGVAESLDDNLPRLDLIPSGQDDGQAGIQVVFLDPADVIPNDINRTFTDEDLSDLLSSVPVVGFLQPAIVIPRKEQPGTFTALIGNRRRAAAQHLGRPLPAIVAASEDAAQQILAILAENEHRLGLKPSQKADLYHQLTLLDWSTTQIAKADGVKPAHVRAALTLIGLPAAAKQAADNGQLDLITAADLAEFSDDPKTLAKIIDKGAGTWGFRHAISEARARRYRDRASDRIFAELTLAGVRVTKKPKDFGPTSQETAVENLRDREGQRIDPEQVQTQPGFAAFIDTHTYGGPKAVVYCLDPEKYGYTRAGYSNYTSPAQQAEHDAAEAARQALAQAHQRATEVRREFLTCFYGNTRAAKTHQPQALRAAITHPGNISHSTSYEDLANAIAGVDITTHVQNARTDRLTRMIVARWVTADEENLTRITTGMTWGTNTRNALDYLNRLITAGYELSDAEQNTHTDLTQWLTDDTTGEDTDEQADTDDEDEDDPADPDPSQHDQ